MRFALCALRLIKGVEVMNILTKRNGIALVAVLAVLLILTLLLPLMFSMSENALYSAVNGTDIQRASYLARSVCEMAVGTFKTTYNVEIPDRVLNGNAENGDEDYVAILAMQRAYNKLYDGEISAINTNPVTMYSKKDATDPNDVSKESIVYSNQKGVTSFGDYTPVGTGNCVITYQSQNEFYLVDNESNYYVIEPDGTKDGKPTSSDFDKLHTIIRGDGENNGTNPLEDATGKALIKKITQIEDEKELEGKTFSVTKVDNRRIIFDATATVNGMTQTRQCVLVLPTYPAKQQWLIFQGPNVGTRNELFVNPEKATGLTPINYSQIGSITDGSYAYQAQSLLTFSCLGNMKVDTVDLTGKDQNYTDKNPTPLVPLDSNGDGKFTKEDQYFKDNYINHKDDDGDSDPVPIPQSFAMGIAPGLNTTPNGDENWAIIDGINSANYYNDTQRNNFVAFSAQNSLTVDVPVRLIVNPTRASRLGDGFDTNHSIFKSFIFQAKDIVFNKQVDMFVSFYTPTFGSDARRMSSVVLSAPPGSYPYVKESENIKVNAGKVFFLEDCYVWIINYGNDGSGYSDNWYEVASTVYYKDSDLLKVKIASAGDVYYFNSDITMTQTGDGGRPIKTGFNLAAYAIEVIYMQNYNTLVTDATPWWDIWQKANQALFGWYLKSDYMDFHAKNPTYDEDDFYKIGNIYEGGDVDLSIPDSDQLYTYWSD